MSNFNDPDKPIFSHKDIGLMLEELTELMVRLDKVETENEEIKKVLDDLLIKLGE